MSDDLSPMLHNISCVFDMELESLSKVSDILDGQNVDFQVIADSLLHLIDDLHKTSQMRQKCCDGIAQILSTNNSTE
jgi:hypothetical protein